MDRAWLEHEFVRDQAGWLVFTKSFMSALGFLTELHSSVGLSLDRCWDRCLDRGEVQVKHTPVEADHMVTIQTTGEFQASPFCCR